MILLEASRKRAWMSLRVRGWTWARVDTCLQIARPLNLKDSGVPNFSART